MRVYACVRVCVCMCVCIYIYILHTETIYIIHDTRIGMYRSGRGSAPGGGAQRVGLYKLFFYLEAFVHESIIFVLPHPYLHCPHYFCTTIAQYTTPPRLPMCMPYTIQYWQW